MSSALTVFFPAAKTIGFISNAKRATVVTTTPHGYQAGIAVTIYIPYPNGNFNRLNGETFEAILVPGFDDVFLIDVDTTLYGAWQDAPNVTVYPKPRNPPPPQVPPPPFQVPSQIAQCVPAGEYGAELLNVANVIGPNNRP